MKYTYKKIINIKNKNVQYTQLIQKGNESLQQQITKGLENMNPVIDQLSSAQTMFNELSVDLQKLSEQRNQNDQSNDKQVKSLTEQLTNLLIFLNQIPKMMENSSSQFMAIK